MKLLPTMEDEIIIAVCDAVREAEVRISEKRLERVLDLVIEKLGFPANPDYHRNNAREPR